MKKKLMAALCAACCLSILNSVKAQELVANAGGFAVNNVSLAWSIGQVATETYSKSGYILTQGFHQSNLTITAIGEAMSDLYQVQVYPNPTNAQLIITSENALKSLGYHTILIYDLQGSMVLKRKGSLNLMTIDMKEYAPSVYLLKIVNPDNTTIQTFHIIKQ